MYLENWGRERKKSEKKIVSTKQRLIYMHFGVLNNNAYAEQRIHSTLFQRSECNKVIVLYSRYY